MPGRRIEALTDGRGAAAISAAMELLDRTLAGTGPTLVPVPAGADPAAAATELSASLDVPAGEPPAVIVSTSGSTGEAKRVLLAATAVRHSAAASLARLGGQGQWVQALPITSIAGISVLARSLAAASMPIGVSEPFTPDAFVAATGQLSAARRYVALVPTQLWRLAAGPPEGLAALASYDAVLVGGAPLDDCLDRAVSMAGVRVVRSYGMTETCGGCVYDGLPLDGVHVRAPRDGPIEIGGPVVFAGYAGRPDLTAAALRFEDGERWHVTNDVGRMDDDRLQVEGRIDDLVISGGVKISPHAVRQTLAGLPGVRELVLFGVPDSEWGQRVVAAIVPEDAGAPPTLEGVRAYGRSALPGPALPRQVLLVPEIPLLASGKPDLAALRALARR